jgi:hypothetical protein
VRRAAAATFALLCAGPALAQQGDGAARLVAEFEAKRARGEALVAEIGAMAARDQFIRDILIQGFQQPMTMQTRQAYIDETEHHFDRIDGQNTARLKEILKEISWTELRTLSPRAANAAYLIISHSSDVAFQREMLAIFEPLAVAGDMNGDQYANLYDDVALGENRLQRYGMNHDCVGGEHRPRAIEDPDHVDARRAAIGLQPLAAYTAQIAQMYGPCPAE